jgi:hypothetical protein
MYKKSQRMHFGNGRTFPLLSLLAVGRFCYVVLEVFKNNLSFGRKGTWPREGFISVGCISLLTLNRVLSLAEQLSAVSGPGNIRAGSGRPYQTATRLMRNE